MNSLGLDSQWIRSIVGCSGTPETGTDQRCEATRHQPCGSHPVRTSAIRGASSPDCRLLVEPRFNYLTLDSRAKRERIHLRFPLALPIPQHFNHPAVRNGSRILSSANLPTLNRPNNIASIVSPSQPKDLPDHSTIFQRVSSGKFRGLVRDERRSPEFCGIVGEAKSTSKPEVCA